MSTENIRFVINETVRQFAKNGTYLEIGMLQGCSLLAAALFNPTTRCIGVDNFAEFNDSHENESVLKENLKKFGNPENIEFHNADYREAIKRLFLKEPRLRINVYFYDGKHDYENQLEGLRIIVPYLAQKCVLLVDDINWDATEKANREFVRENSAFKSVFRIKTEENCSKNWWNGLEIITRGI